jgi:hypothetical protein
MTKYKEDDINLLLPSFRPKVQAVYDGMQAAGYRPCLRDTVRTQAEADANAEKGTGSSRSMHMYGCAADIICDEHGWSCAAVKCKFYTKLGALVEAQGLFWGGRFQSVDQPHMQGVAPTPKAQNAMRALGTADRTAGARDALVRRELGLDAMPDTAELLRAEMYAKLDLELVKQFQREHKLTADGKLGPKTLAALSAALT